jgi:hypothetical protein
MGGNLLEKELNKQYQLFINKFLYYFMREFPLKLIKKRDNKNSGYLTN